MESQEMTGKTAGQSAAVMFEEMIGTEIVLYEKELWI